MDGYFNALDAETTSGGLVRDNSKLLDGITADLTKGANDAYAAVDLLFQDWLMGSDIDLSGGRKEQVRDFFLEFSEAELVGENSLQTMIEAYEKCWNSFQDTKAPLDRSLVLLLKWRGEGAETAKSYIQGLVNTYSRVGTKLTVLEADIVAARDAIATARADLSALASSFLTAAEKYRDDQERQDESALTKALAAGFAGAVAALLVAAVPPAGAALTAATFFTTANGVQVAGAAAGAGLSTLVSENASIIGDSPETIYNSFHDGVVNIREGMFRAAESLISKINVEINNLPIVPEPPDVSPGETFDPGNFETENTDKGTEKRVRDKNVDISNDGRFEQPPMELSPLPTD
ncbi:hypothetical protein SD37_41725 [Amycolatopsis orientalis]|uniref:Uncharacterized protein n=1 Tax=Amycolatopsis orientalis TaxID=31958 RepID=A0A193CAW6_AMYOR|nr:hypothetical protein [Amycolatopsis orientalis]ANN21455.1 hypothetical protein SD37_41725 [Amycolatopsis orientalis]